MPPHRHIDGAEEQLELLEPILTAAARELGYLMHLPPTAVADCLAWVARESFKLGYQHAHSRSTDPAPGAVAPESE